MKKIYCVKLMNNFSSSVQERTYIGLRFKEEDQDLLPIIKQALSKFKVYQAIEARSNPAQPTMAMAGGVYAGQMPVSVVGRTVAFEAPGADVVSINIHLVEALEQTGLFSMVSVIQESYLSELLRTKACQEGDPLAEGNDAFMTIDPDPALREQLNPIGNAINFVPPGYGKPPVLGVQSVHQPMTFSGAAKNPAPAPEVETYSTPKCLMALSDFLSMYRDQLQDKLMANGISKARAANQVNRLSTDLPMIREVANRLAYDSGMVSPKIIEGETVGVRYTGVDFNK